MTVHARSYNFCSPVCTSQGLKAEIPTQRVQVQQINSNCSEFLDSSTGPDQNSDFMKSLTKLSTDWEQLQVNVSHYALPTNYALSTGSSALCIVCQES